MLRHGASIAARWPSELISAAFLQQRHLGGALLRAQLIDDRVRVLHDEPGVLRGDGVHELLAAGQRILAAKSASSKSSSV